MSRIVLWMTWALKMAAYLLLMVLWLAILILELVCEPDDTSELEAWFMALGIASIFATLCFMAGAIHRDPIFWWYMGSALLAYYLFGLLYDCILRQIFGMSLYPPIVIRS